jgi:hypothetical protein
MKCLETVLRRNPVGTRQEPARNVMEDSPEAHGLKNDFN